jgi:hypothetical protein
MQRTFPSYQPPSLKTFFSNTNLAQLASQTLHIYNYIADSLHLAPS